MKTRQLYLVDDNEDFLQATCFWLEGLGLTVTSWQDPATAIKELGKRDKRVEACLMLDIRMPELSGLDVHDALIAADANLPVIYMSGHANVPLTVQAMEKGAVTLLEKPFDEQMLQSALDRAFAEWTNTGSRAATQAKLAPAIQSSASENPASSGLADAVNGDLTDEAQRQAHEAFTVREASLSPREREVLSYAIKGVYNKNIAEEIGLSIKTVELYRSRGMAKMQARSIADLTRMMVTARV